MLFQFVFLQKLSRMTKQEYFRSRLRKDFLDLSLIQSDTLPASKIADDIVMSINFEDLYLKLKGEIEVVCEKYFSIELLKSDGRISNDMPVFFNLGTKAAALADFESIINNIDVQAIIKDVIGKISQAVEVECWHNGISEMCEAIRMVEQRFKNYAGDYRRMNETLEFNDDELDEKYEAAQNVSFMERMMDNNCDDILIFRAAMLLNTKAHCQEMCNNKIAMIYNELSGNKVFRDFEAYFALLSKHAEDFGKEIPCLERNVEWDREYEKIVPVEFYRRNAKLINMEHAFHMILLNVFAKNESWMLDNKFLTDNDLSIFTSMDENLIEKLVAKVEGLIID